MATINITINSHFLKSRSPVKNLSVSDITVVYSKYNLGSLFDTDRQLSLMVATGTLSIKQIYKDIENHGYRDYVYQFVWN